MISFAGLSKSEGLSSLRFRRETNPRTLSFSAEKSKKKKNKKFLSFIFCSIFFQTLSPPKNLLHISIETKKEETKNKRARTTTTTTTTTTTRTSEVAREFYYSNSRIFSSRGCATSTSSDFCDEIFGYHRRPNAAWMKVKTMKRNEEEEDKCSDCVFTAHSVKERKTTTIHEPKVHTWTSIAKSLFAGGIAGGVSRTAVAPLERLKILQQVHGRTATEYGTVYRGLNTILGKDGLRGFLSGTGRTAYGSFRTPR